MKIRQNAIALATGIAIGISAAGPMAQAAESWLRATPSTPKFYVDGRQVQLEAYEINGYNYIKLRDMGKAVGFEVDYDANTNSVLIGSRTKQTDYATQPDPSIFAGDYTREMYDALGYALTHPEEIAAGTYRPISMGEVNVPTALRLTGKLSAGSTRYSLTQTFDSDDQYLQAEHNSDYDAAIAHIQPFLHEISSLPQAEQVRQMVWYIADRMTYSTRIKARPAQILAQDEVIEGAGSCMTYSSCLSFLCEQAGIPCILVVSCDHQWNMVYVDGQWWHVDPTSEKANLHTMDFHEYSGGVWREVTRSEEERQAILQATRASSPVLRQTIGEVPYADGTVRIDPSYIDERPQETRFLQELLVPGSTVKN